jgi:glycosyltransferase involved in cell wall biosynthesis
MKILIYAHHFPPSLGGMQFSNFQKAQGLYSLGHHVEVITCNSKGARNYTKNLEFTVHLLPKWPLVPIHSTSGSSLLNWIFIPYYRWKLSILIRKIDPERVLVADETANFFWSFLAKRYKNRYVSYCSVPLLTLLRSRRSYRLGLVRLIQRIKNFFPSIILRGLNISYENAKLLLVVSSSTKNQLATQIPHIASTANIIPNSINNMFFDKNFQFEKVKALKHRFSISEDQHILLSVTRLTYNKGVDDILKALHSLSPSDLHKLKYVIVGEGPAFRYLKDLSTRLNLDDTVVFTGKVQHLDLIPYYDMCNFFILCPRRGPYESFGRVFVEAAARSKPSIASLEGGMLDVVNDQSTGILVPPGNIPTLRDKILFLINHPDISVRLGENAKINAEAKFTSNCVAHQFENLLNIAGDPR